MLCPSLHRTSGGQSCGKSVDREKELFGDNPRPNYEGSVLDYAEGEKPQKGKVSAVKRHQETVAATDAMYKKQVKAHDEKVRAQEEREEQEKVWRLALQSIDQARHANAPGHEPNTSKPISGQI